MLCPIALITAGPPALCRIPSDCRRANPWLSTLVAVTVYAIGLFCTIMVYTGVTMTLAKRSRAKSTRLRHVRRSVTLPPKIARKVEALAKERGLSDNRVLIELIEQGIEARQQKEKAFFQLAERFRTANDPEQVRQLGDQLGRFVFGE
jgi:hypothetical protein